MQKVELLVQNTPGVLGCVVAHICNESWNIKRFFVDETEQESISKTEMDIEGTHTKLALVKETVHLAAEAMLFLSSVHLC